MFINWNTQIFSSCWFKHLLSLVNRHAYACSWWPLFLCLLLVQSQKSLCREDWMELTAVCQADKLTHHNSVLLASSFELIVLWIQWIYKQVLYVFKVHFTIGFFFFFSVDILVDSGTSKYCSNHIIFNLHRALLL